MAENIDFRVKNGLVVTTTATVEGSSQSTSTNSGALQVIGGAGIGGNLYIGGITNIPNNTSATSTITGALRVVGGVGVGGDVYVGGDLISAGTFYGSVVGTITTATNFNNGTAGQVPYQSAPGVTNFFGPGTAGNVLVSNGAAAPTYRNNLSLGVITATSIIITSTQASTSSFSANALYVAGGIGGNSGFNINGDSYLSGNLNVSGYITGTNVTLNLLTANSGTFYGDATGAGALYAGVLGYTPFPQTMFQATGDSNTYMEINVQNVNAGNRASTDIVASADNVTDSNAFIDMGITSSGWDGTQPDSFGANLGPNDGYLLVGNTSGPGTGHLVIGTLATDTNVKIVVAGTATSYQTAVFNTSNTDSVNTETGSLVLTGGAGISGSVTIGGKIVGLDTTASTSTVTANSLYIAGGVGIGKTLLVTGEAIFQNNVTFSGTSTYIFSTNTYYTDNLINIHMPSTDPAAAWTVDDGKDIGHIYHYYKDTDKHGFLGIANDTGYLEWYDDGLESGGVFTGTHYGTIKTGAIVLRSSTSSESTSTGALTVRGGVGIGGNLYVGGTIYGYASVTGIITTATNIFGGSAGQLVYQSNAGVTAFVNTGTTGQLLMSSGTSAPVYVNTASIVVGYSTNIAKGATGQIPYQTAPGITSFISTATSGTVLVSNGLGAPAYQNTLTLAGTTAASSTTTGALQVVGGVGVGGNLYVGGNEVILGDLEVRGGDITTDQSTFNLINSNATAVNFAGSGTSITIGATTGYTTIRNAVTITSTTESSSTNTGALQVYGGLGVGGAIFAASTSYINNSRILVAGDLETVITTATFITNDPTSQVGLSTVAGTSTAYGTYNFGDASSISSFNDYNTGTNTGFYSINDASGAPAHIVYVGFTNITTFTRLVLNLNYTQSSGHTIQIDLYNFQTVGWDSFTTYSGSPGWTQFILETFDSAPYISSGKTYARLNHTSSGNTAHRTWIDYVVLEDSIQGGQGPRGATGATGATGPQGLTTSTTSTFNFFSTEQSVSTITGAVRVVGGVGIGGDVYVGGTIYGVSTTATNIAGGQPGYIPVQLSSGITRFINTGSVGSLLQMQAGNTATFVSTATLTVGYSVTATNIAAGTAGQLTYQSAPGVTGFAGPGTAGQLLMSSGTSAPVYINTSSISVGYSAYANTATNLAVGSIGSLPYQSGAGVTAMLTLSTAGYVLVAGVSAPQWTPLSAIAANTATTIAGGLAGQLHYQTGPGATSFVSTGTTGTVLVSNGSASPVYQNTLTLAGTAISISTTTGALQVAGGIGVGDSIYVKNRVGFVNTSNVSVVYQFYNAATNSLDTVFG